MSLKNLVHQNVTRLKAQKYLYVAYLLNDFCINYNDPLYYISIEKIWIYGMTIMGDQ